MGFGATPQGLGCCGGAGLGRKNKRDLGWWLPGALWLSPRIYKSERVVVSRWLLDRNGKIDGLWIMGRPGALWLGPWIYWPERVVVSRWFALRLVRVTRCYIIKISNIPWVGKIDNSRF